MSDAAETGRRAWRIPDTLWACLAPLLAPRPPPPRGGHRPRGEERRALEASCGVRRPGCHWHALTQPGLCASRSAHRRVHAWAAADVFVELWKRGLTASAPLQGREGEWLAMEGGMTKAPRGGKKVGQNPTTGSAGPSAVSSPTAARWRARP